METKCVSNKWSDALFPSRGQYFIIRIPGSHLKYKRQLNKPHVAV